MGKGGNRGTNILGTTLGLDLPRYYFYDYYSQVQINWTCSSLEPLVFKNVIEVLGTDFVVKIELASVLIMM